MSLRSAIIGQRMAIGGYPAWMKKAASDYDIPIANLAAAYAIDNDIKKSFDGTGRWLKGDGNTYVNTGIPNDYWGTLRIVADMRKTSMQYNESGYFGGKGDTNQAPTIFSSPNSESISCWCGSGSGVSCFNVSIMERFKLDLTFDSVNDTRTIYKNDVFVLKVNATHRGRNNGGYLSIFSDGSTPMCKAFMDVQSFQIIKDNDKHYYIPIRLTDGTCTMYDLIASKALEPQGTGSFTIE